MTDQPDPKRIDRAALDRIVQRAAELQTGERDIGDNLSPEDVLELGRDVGIPAKFMQQAILEHQTVSASAIEDGTMSARVIGPTEVRAQRVIQGNQELVIASLITWMDKNELLVVQRQQSGWVSWEPLRGMQAAIRRGTASLDTSKPKFMLSRAETVVATATPLETGYVHVTLTASLADTRRRTVGGALTTFGIGLLGAGAFVAFGLGAVAVAPLLPFTLLSYVMAKRYRPLLARVHLGLERALDFLERGGVKPAHESVPKAPSLLELVAGEVRRAITSGSDRADQARRLRRSVRAKRPEE